MVLDLIEDQVFERVKPTCFFVNLKNKKAMTDF